MRVRYIEDVGNNKSAVDGGNSRKQNQESGAGRIQGWQNTVAGQTF